MTDAPDNASQTEQPKRDWFDKATLLVAIVGVVAVAAAAGVGAWTAVIMNRQLGEMHSGGIDTHNLAIATQHLAEAARDQAKNAGQLVVAAKAQADAMGKLRKAGEDQAAASKAMRDSIKAQTDKIAGLYGAIQSSAKAGADAAKAAIAQSDATKAEAESVKGQTAAVQQSLIATRDMAAATRDAAKASERGNDIANRAYLAADRPWTGVNSLVFSPSKPAANLDFTVTLTLQNTGRSPSLNTRAEFFIRIVDAASWKAPDMDACNAGCSSSTLLPQGTTTYAPRLTKDTLTQDVIKDIEAIKKAIVIYGRIDYADESGTTHKTFVCQFWNPVGGNLSSCTGSNGAD